MEGVRGGRQEAAKQAGEESRERKLEGGCRADRGGQMEALSAARILPCVMATKQYLRLRHSA